MLDLGSGVYIEWNTSVVSSTVHGHRCHFSSWWEKVSPKLLGSNAAAQVVAKRLRSVVSFGFAHQGGLQCEISNGWLSCIDCLLVGGTLWCVCWQSKVGQEENV